MNVRTFFEYLCACSPIDLKCIQTCEFHSSILKKYKRGTHCKIFGEERSHVLSTSVAHEASFSQFNHVGVNKPVKKELAFLFLFLDKPISKKRKQERTELRSCHLSTSLAGLPHPDLLQHTSMPVHGHEVGKPS